MKTVSGNFVVASALLVMLLLASCATLRQPPDPVEIQAQIAEAREQEIALVRATVADPQRAERLLELLVERDRLVEEHARNVIEHREKIAVLAADYDARREDFEALLTQLNRQRTSAQKETIDLVTAMKATTTAEEWKVISRFQLKRLEPRKLVYGAAAQGG
jgi:flagellar motility protein MotE (MotC chaperone)